MNKKVGRNDPCPCGSGKKYKQCCLQKQTPSGKRKLTATWINAPKAPNLMQRTYGSSIAASDKEFTPLAEENEDNKESLSGNSSAKSNED